MKKVKVFFVFLVALLLLPGLSSRAFSEGGTDVVGTVLDAQGNPVKGVEISVQDADGKVVAQAVTNDKGGYIMKGLAPGQYNLALNPLATGFQGETVATSLGSEGLTVNWTVSAAAPAVAVATPGVAGGGIFGLGKTSTFLGGLGLVGGGVGGATGGGAFDSGGTSSASPLSSSQ